MSKKSERFWRVSAFAAGVTNIGATCKVHKSSRDRLKAEEHFFKLAAGVGTKFEMVILHQGNLRGNAHRIWLDTRHYFDPLITHPMKHMRAAADRQRANMEAEA